MKRETAARDGIILGIDVGSVSISVVGLDMHGNLVDHIYALHHGDVRNKLTELTGKYDRDRIRGIASPSGKTHFRSVVKIYDQQVSLMEGVKFLHLDARSILHVGAERFYLIELDGAGNYLQTSHSSSCAAGTGSFLDQQARRLNLKDTSALSNLALQNGAPIPDIAARCSVFAKTDLIHAQQQGYGLKAICASLCKGLADNIADTLFHKTLPESPVIISGGVARNRSVVDNLSRIIGKEIGSHELSHHLPAIGAASLLFKDLKGQKDLRPVDPEGLLEEQGERSYYYKPLETGRGVTRDIEIEIQYTYDPVTADHMVGVQVDRYRVSPSGPERFFLGIDIGSTSTKALLLNTRGEPYAGFYTYTSGQPLRAVQALFEAMVHMASENEVNMAIEACGTTGSGRKFIGSIVRADQDVDEITAHARAAFELNPLTDTIIEIGGQDAKFTQMKEGVVTFSHMNTVCAAGTGSFIEELAGRLGVELKDYERMAMGRPAPLASDRCTVFMERDINQLLSNGYSVEEVLATVIHSVRENYLKKVASEAHIGDHICFQGATARNRALVAAFEQRLKKPVYVSSLCHLTGALGTALLLKEEHTGKTSFRGLDLYRKAIPIETETCELCLNRCTISVAAINGEKQAYGFLCGRDYETKKFVSKGSVGFELLRERRKLVPAFSPIRPGKPRAKPCIGIPAALHLVEDLPYWQTFFKALGIDIRSSKGYKDSLKTGKKMAGAEFCAPIDSMYGHVAYLSENCDYIFMPVHLESRVKPEGMEENLCYYSQFSASLAFLQGAHMKEKLISPMLNFHKNEEHNAKILLKSVRKMGFSHLSVADIQVAMKKAEAGDIRIKQQLQDLFQSRFKQHGEIAVVLLGRPYVVLSDVLNKGIPDLFTRKKVNAFYQDMLQVDPGRDAALNNLLKKIPWHFAANILRATDEVGRTRNLYPVMITAFKCAPDSFILEYFKQIMHLYGKPYLIIQIDEHDSNTGYETRIEAALRSFRNHARATDALTDPDLASLLPHVETSLDGKTLMMPNWDMFVSPLVVANLRRAGIDARLLETSELSIRKSMVHNTGQCLPISIIAQDYMDYMRKYKLDPSNSILWMMEGRITCNLRQYPYYIKRILENQGDGMEKAGVYSGEMTHREMPMGVTYYAYFAYMLGGLFRKIACRIRPYEMIAGQTDEVIKKVQQILIRALSGKQSIDSAIKEGLDLVGTIRYDKTRRKPLVAIFGDLYVRDNDIMNQELIGAIEAAGGEALVTPYHDYFKIIVENVFRRAGQRGEHVETSLNRIMLHVLKFMDDRYYRPFSKYLGPAPTIRPGELEKHLKDFNISLLHSGESYDNILKIFYIIENYPEVALFVQTNPSYCCPALVTEAMTQQIRKMTDVPIVTLTYDGTSDRMNDIIVPYIRNARSTCT